MIIKRIEKDLFDNQDLVYRDFNAKLIPNIDKEKTIGVRTPILRNLSKVYVKEESINDFLNVLPHKYYEETNLHGFIISELKDYDLTIKKINEFLPFIDNWATCDLLSPKCFRKNRDKLKTEISKWILSDKTYTIRFGIEMAMSHFLDEDFDLNLMEKISLIRSDEYYVNMMIAWYFATALSKQWNNAIFYVEKQKLSEWVHNKTIQKAIESYRITDEQKTYLRRLKIKKA